MGSMTQFFIKEQAEEGKRVDLHLPTGEQTDDYLIIRSAYSDAFVEAKNQAYRDALANDNEVDTNRVLASLIKEWSFDEELTLDSATQFLTNAPQVAEQLNKLSADAEFFYSKKPGS